VGRSDNPSLFTLQRTAGSVRFNFSAIKRVGVFCLMSVLSCLTSSFDHDRGFERPSLVPLFFDPALALVFGDFFAFLAMVTPKIEAHV
jgi:hypothetical protein